MHAMKKAEEITNWFLNGFILELEGLPNIETRLAVCPYAPVEASARISPAAEVEPT